MRALVCASTYPPEHDGISRAAWTVAEGLARRGYTVEVATTFHPERAAAAVAETSLVVHEFRVAACGEGEYSGEVEAFQEWLLAAGFDVVICHGWHVWPTDLVIAIAPRLRARKVLISHGFGAHLAEWHARFPWGLAFGRAGNRTCGGWRKNCVPSIGVCS